MTHEPRPVFCVDCKHCFPHSKEENSICQHPSNISLVTGSWFQEECRTMRGYGFACGPYGALFEGKVKDAFDEVFRDDGEILRGLAE